MNEVSIITAFLSGLVTFFAPCTFVTLPAFISYISTEALSSEDDLKNKKRKMLISALLYSAGFILVFTLLGLTASAVGLSMISNKENLQRIGGFLMIFAGLFILFGDKIKSLSFVFNEKKISLDKVKRGKFIFPFIIGVTSAFAWTPCIGPVLGSILFLAGASSESPLQGAFLLFVHSLGITIPFIIMTILFEQALPLIKKLGKYTKTLYKIGGFIIILVGISLLFGFYTDISAFVYKTFAKLGYDVH